MGTQVMGLSGSRALVMGLGVHGGGVGVARYLVGSGARVHVTDMQSPDRLGASIDALSDLPVGYTLGHHDTSDLDGIDFLVRNPGVPREAPFLLEAERRGIPIYMEMTLFFLACPSRRIVAITGTKGKTTTTTLTGEIFRRAGRDTVVAGNLRVSALGQLSRITPTTDVILELSSFQLEGLDAIRTSPRTAAVTNLMVDHLNRYPDMASYMDAKRRIFIYQGSGDVLRRPPRGGLSGSIPVMRWLVLEVREVHGADPTTLPTRTARQPWRGRQGLQRRPSRRQSGVLPGCPTGRRLSGCIAGCVT